MQLKDGKVKKLIESILENEKAFLNEKNLNEKEKVRVIKKLIEEEVTVDDN